ncbi:MAG: hypothetical protein ACUVUQ_00715 [Thermodesulfovibrionales bacterium]
MNLLVKTVFVIVIILFLGCAVIKERPSGSNKVPICHKGNTIYVNESAVDAHLVHGDYIGICK